MENLQNNLVAWFINYYAQLITQFLSIYIAYSLLYVNQGIISYIYHQAFSRAKMPRKTCSFNFLPFFFSFFVYSEHSHSLTQWCMYFFFVSINAMFDACPSTFSLVNILNRCFKRNLCLIPGVLHQDVMERDMWMESLHHTAG